ncbi:MAG: polysaccharide deacetylase family protein [Hyphomicrobiales bacterium]|nr:polysaccharide deacetylase family protein [Hyphomicrobiales bacterium]
MTFLSVPEAVAACRAKALGVSRTLEIDASPGLLVGSMHYGKRLALKPKEVVLTFDDGPLSGPTDRVLKALAAECVKATFFMVGLMADAYPALVRKVAAAGHTIATHSNTHPRGMTSLELAVAERDIERGFQRISAALGEASEPAPFFRYPGLAPSPALDTFLLGNGIATFSADIVGDDWHDISSSQILSRVLHRLDHQGRGIILLHDIKPRTALMIPRLLRALKSRGYKIVHLVPRREGFEVSLRSAVYKPDEDDAPAASIEPAKSVETVMSDAPAASIEPAKSVEPVKPFEPAISVETAKSIETARAP